ncbi:hypothetical protein ABIE67_007529 [Streptomyces sp. V4I8]
MSLAWAASSAAGAMWLIIRKPETSMPRSRALAMCWAEMSASVQWVAMRTERTPRAWARSSSAIVPIPGRRRVVSTASSIASAAASIHSQSVWLPGP